MKSNKLVGFAFLLLAASTIVLCIFAYYSAVSQAMFSSSKTDIRILEERNNLIISEFLDSGSTGEWQDITDRHDDVIVLVKDAYGNTVAGTSDKTWSLLDVKVTTSFVYKDVRYNIKSSVYFERTYLTDSAFIARICIVLIAVIMVLVVLVATIIYVSMLRPYRRLYRSIENFDSEDVEFKKMKSTAYTSRVYNKMCDLRERVSKEKLNQHRIIASISHDIKTPLTSIMGYAEQLKKPNLPEERQRRYLDIIYEKSIEIRNLIDGFDEYLGYITHPQLYTEPYSTEEMIHFVTDNYKYDAESNGIRLTVTNNAPGRYAKLEKQKALRILGNLFNNSVKHFDKDEKIIDITLSCKDGKIFFTFSDNGCGVEPGKMKLIFEPLYTSDEGRKVAGLGLSICGEIVESLGGKIWAEDSPYGGLSICGYFPEYRAIH